ncbi:hypothetical protein PUN28_011301 [Cardiocondyla obscurior]
MMEDVDGMHVQTPSVSVNSSSHDSVDSGYLSIMTPQTSSCTPKMAGYRTRSSSGALHSAKKHRHRPEPFHCEKLQRYRSKLSRRLNTTELDYFPRENSVEHDSMLETSCTQVHGNLSLVHSTPSCDQLGNVLRSGRSWKITAPVTPASTNLQILSPPPSPAVPSSSFAATEPVREDAEMKLVRTPQSKSPRVTTPLKFKLNLIPRIVISPVHTGSSPTITSADNRKLRELRITELGTAEIKPKKLDFSHRGLYASLLNSRRASSYYTGREKVDFFSLLGEESNHLNLVSKILSFLPAQDLCSVSMVSRTWRRICKNDFPANKRRLSFIMCKHTIKENLLLVTMAKKAKHEEDIQTSPRSRRNVRKGYLLDVQNLLNVVPAQPNSPPVSPSKIKFYSYIKEGRELKPNEHLLPCPRCNFPCHVNNEKNVGSCSRQGCSIEFCASCSSKPHTDPCKTLLLATPTKRNNKRLIVGSRQSKRNLRRL